MSKSLWHVGICHLTIVSIYPVARQANPCSRNHLILPRQAVRCPNLVQIDHLVRTASSSLEQHSPDKKSPSSPGLSNVRTRDESYQGHQVYLRAQEGVK